MPSSEFAIEHEGGPPMVADQFAHWLSGTAIHCVLGVVLGMLIARAMRAHHLHWSWSAGALALLLVCEPTLPGQASTLALACLSASVRSRRWHREDLEAGADLAELANARRTPLELLRPLVQASCERVREMLGAKWGHRRDLVLGVDEHGRAVSIPFGGSDGGSHALVVGATGSGKTVTQTSIADHAITEGMAVVVIDPKGDRGMREQLCSAAIDAGRSFIEWTPDGERIYNPFARGSASEIADKVLAGEHFTEPHYLRQAQRYLGHVVRALRCAEIEVSLRAIVEHLDPTRLEALVRELPRAQADPTFAYLDSLSARQRNDLSGVRDRLAIVTESDVGPWLDPDTEGAGRFELLAAVRERAVVYFSLQSDRRPLLSQMLGAAIVQDLQTAAAASQSRPVPTLVVIDEFSAVAAEQVVRLFGRARSAGFSLLLGTQELSDLRPPGRERLLEQVLGNLSVLIAHRQVVPSSAELISSIAGTRGAWRVSRHSDGKATRTRGREPVLDPGRVLSLERGWAAVLVLEHGGSARIARIFPPQR
jgi:type IV secretory pathway TraG/TraD family ATPase VirD4